MDQVYTQEAPRRRDAGSWLAWPPKEKSWSHWLSTRCARGATTNPLSRQRKPPVSGS